MMWNRYGLRTIVLQSDLWKESKIWFIWTTGKHHERPANSPSYRTRDNWCRKINTSSFSRHFGLGFTNLQETAKTEYNSILITAKLTDPIYNHKLDYKYNPSDQQYTRNTQSRIWQKNAKCWNGHNELFEELTLSHTNL